MWSTLIKMWALSSVETEGEELRVQKISAAKRKQEQNEEMCMCDSPN